MVSFAQAAGSQFVLLLVSVPWWVRLALGFVQASWWEGLVPVYWWVKQDLVLLVHKAVSKGMFKGFEQLVCWWVALCSYCDDCLTWGVPALLPAGIWVRPGIGVKLVSNCCFNSFVCLYFLVFFCFVLFCSPHDVLIYQSMCVQKIILSCWSFNSKCVFNILHLYSTSSHSSWFCYHICLRIFPYIYLFAFPSELSHSWFALFLVAAFSFSLREIL